MDYTVTLSPDDSRYEIAADGETIGFADVRWRDGKAVFPHTEVSPRRRGQGVAAKLVAAALDDVRAKGLTVVPLCWYVDQFISEHPEYHDLREGGR